MSRNRLAGGVCLCLCAAGAMAETVDVNGFQSFVVPIQPAFDTGPDGRLKAASESPGTAPGFKSAIEPVQPALIKNDDGRLSAPDD